MARLSAAQALFDADPDGDVKDLFIACVFEAVRDPDAVVRAAAGGAAKIFFDRFQPAKHQDIFKSMLTKLPPVMEDDKEVEVEGEIERVSASEAAYAKLTAAAGSDHEKG